jgi:hypothetical protein
VEKALHEKGQQLESVKYTIREVFGISATSQRSSDAQTPSTDDGPTRVCLTAHEGSHIINEAMTTIAW